MVRLDKEPSDSNHDTSAESARAEHAPDAHNSPATVRNPHPPTLDLIRDFTDEVSISPTPNVPRREVAVTPPAPERPAVRPEVDQQERERRERTERITQEVHNRHRVRTRNKVGTWNKDHRVYGGIGPLKPDGVGEHLGAGLTDVLISFEINPTVQNEIDRQIIVVANERIKGGHHVDFGQIKQELTTGARAVATELAYPSGDLMKPVILLDEKTKEPPQTQHQQEPMSQRERDIVLGSPLLRAGQEGRHLGLYVKPNKLTTVQRELFEQYRDLDNPYEKAEFLINTGLNPAGQIELQTVFNNITLDEKARVDLFEQIKPEDRVAFLAAEVRGVGMFSPLQPTLEQAMKLANTAPVSPYIGQVDRYIRHEIDWHDLQTWRGMNPEAFDGPANTLMLKSLQRLGVDLGEESKFIKQGLPEWERRKDCSSEQIAWYARQAELLEARSLALDEHFGLHGGKTGMSNHDLARQVESYVQTQVNPLRAQHGLKGTWPKIPILGQSERDLTDQVLTQVKDGIIKSLPNAPDGLRRDGPGSLKLQESFRSANDAIELGENIHILPDVHAKLIEQQRHRGNTRAIDEAQHARAVLTEQELALSASVHLRALAAQQEELERARQTGQALELGLEGRTPGD